MRLHFRLMSAASGVALCGIAIPALAQTAPAPDNAPEIVVTGTANSQGVLKQAAPYAITTMNEQLIKDVAPTSAADLVKIVPGLYAETTGGVAGPNIEVRGFPTAGDAPYVTMQLDGLPIFPAATLSFLDNSSQLRVDDTLKRVEATIGGPAVLWGSGQPGATINWVEKNGKTDQNGLLRGTVGNGGLFRVDGYFGGEIANGWYASIGGFWRTDHGIRDTQYPADRGGQIVGTITHDIDGGTVTLYGRTTNDKNAFFTPIPLLNTGTATNPKLAAYPGFDPLTATFLGNANRIAALPGGPTLDLADGRGIDNHVVGVDFTKSLGDRFDFSNKLSYMWGTATCACQFTGDNPTTLGAYAAAQVAADIGRGAPAGTSTTIGSATLVGSGTAITDMNTPVIDIGVWYVRKDLTAFQDEARLAFHVTPTNTVTLGAWFSDSTSHDIWDLGNAQLMTMSNNATPIAVTMSDGSKLTNADGFASSSSYSINNRYDGKNIAGIIADHWDVTPRFTVDLGARFEHESVNGTLISPTSQFIGTAANQLYAYGASVATTPTSLSFRKDAAAYAIDADYQIAHNFNAFLGFNHGYILPTFDDLRSGVFDTTHVDQLQGGIKRNSRLWSLNLTGFYNAFAGQRSEQILSDGTIVEYVTSSHTEGLEFQGALRPFTGVQLDLDGTYQHGKYTAGGTGITNETVVRQPAFQLRFTPSYSLPFGNNKARVFGTVSYIGKRYADLQNDQVLPSYTTLDLGAEVQVSKAVELRVSANNVTNTLAITEGNTRVLGTGLASNGVFLGRPLFGASYQFSAAIHF